MKKGNFTLFYRCQGERKFLFIEIGKTPQEVRIKRTLRLFILEF